MGELAFEVFYDGDCPLCRREITLLQRLDSAGTIRFTDIAAAGFDPVPLGKTRGDLMARIQGRTAAGEWVEGVEVFRHLYAAVGFERLVALTRWPGVRSALDVGYAWFARNRLRLTGRCDDVACQLPQQGR